MSNNNGEVRERILRIVKGFLRDNLEDYTIEITTASKIGENWLGLLYNITITDRRNGKNPKLNLIIKMAPYQELYREVFPVRAVYDREIFVYDKIIPEFLNFQMEKKVPHIFQPFAKHYLTTMQHGGEALLMDNMKLKGYVTGDHKVEVDYPHALLVMKELGKFHALSYAIKDQKPEMFKYVEENCLEVFFNSRSFRPVLKIIETLGERVLESLDPIKENLYVETLKNCLAKAASISTDFLSVEKFGQYGVINHGDPQMRNLMFKYGDCAHPAVPTELCFIDWQLTRIASPVMDILWFIFLCTGQEFRNRHYKDLLGVYYESLSSMLYQLGSDPRKLLPFEILMSHLKQFAPFGLYVAIWIGAANMKESTNIQDVYNSISEDMLIDGLSVVPHGDYLPKIRGIVIDFVKYGYNF
ncbi:hypothetical protein RI129_008581 [Pyrocoelia pectoralis]|uniref:CHK kinase-like domain-containing protein n=1 Tax=Pyrocoelia pectoralis TaxID=417401 RepID=A0AAN7VA48_9COLE